MGRDFKDLSFFSKKEILAWKSRPPESRHPLALMQCHVQRQHPLALMQRHVGLPTPNLEQLPTYQTVDSSFVPSQGDLNPNFLKNPAQRTIMPSKKVDLSKSESPYTDAAQAKKSAKGNHIKRPMNAFIIFSQQRRREVNPGFQHNELSKGFSKEWRNMSEEAKLPYRREAERLKQLHIQENPGYKYEPKKKKTRKAAMSEGEPTRKRPRTEKSRTVSRRTRQNGKETSQRMPAIADKTPSINSSSAQESDQLTWAYVVQDSDLPATAHYVTPNPFANSAQHSDILRAESCMIPNINGSDKTNNDYNPRQADTSATEDSIILEDNKDLPVDLQGLNETFLNSMDFDISGLDSFIHGDDEHNLSEYDPLLKL